MSIPEDMLAFQIATSDILVGRQPETEYRFHDTRKWRFDFAWPPIKLAVEVEGAVWTQGRHTRGQGFINDCEKYNAATELGWRVLRYPASVIEDGTAIIQIERMVLSEE